MSNQYTAYLDPTQHFAEMSEAQIRECTGLVPYFVINPEYMDIPLRDALDKQYCASLYEFKGCTISDDGVYSSNDGDPDLYPYLRIERGDELFFQYEYAICSIVQKDGSTFITRLD